VATDPTAAEPGTDTGLFTITRTGPTTFPLTVYFTRGGTAAYGSDYQTFGSSVSMAAGETSATVTITPIDDTTVEGAETVILTLQANPTTYLVGTPSSATVTISSNE
jgi:hypothetical protein